MIPLRILLVLLILPLLWACPPPNNLRGNGPIVTISTLTDDDATACPDAVAAMDAGDFSRASDLLMSSSSPSPEEDLCLSRALLGLDEDEEALAIAGPLSSAAVVDPETRATACTLAAWAAIRLDRRAEAIALVDRCDSELVLSQDDVLLAADAVPTAAMLLETRVEANRLVGALYAAQWLVEISDSVDGATREWALMRAFSVSELLSDGDRHTLSAQSSELITTVVLHSELLQAIAEGDEEAVEQRLAEVQTRLLAISAEEVLLELSDRLVAAESTRPAVVGCVVTLSGPQRQAGRAVLAGLLLAQGAFEPDNEPTSLLLIRDSGETPGSVAAAVADLDAAGVLAIVGPIDAVLAQETARQAGLRGIPSISLTRDAAVTEASRWTFQLFANPAAEAELLLEAAAMHGLRRVAIAIPAPTPDYIVELVEAFEQGASFMGIAVDEPVRYFVDDLQAEADSTAAILAARDFDALFIADTGENATTLAAYLGVHDIWSRPVDRPASSTRREIVFLGTSFWHNPEFLASGPDYLAGGLFPSWVPVESERFVTAEFARGFESTYGRRPGIIGAFAYDALNLLHLILLDDAVRTRQGIWHALDQAVDVEGVTGDLQFGAERTTVQRPALFTVTRGGFEPR